MRTFEDAERCREELGKRAKKSVDGLGGHSKFPTMNRMHQTVTVQFPMTIEERNLERSKAMAAGTLWYSWLRMKVGLPAQLPKPEQATAPLETENV